jgi:hypothetical protein
MNEPTNGSEGPRRQRKLEDMPKNFRDAMGVVIYSGMMWEALAADVDACEELLRSQDLPSTRRQLVRAIFALIEASTYYAKREALGMARDRGHEVALLVEAALLDIGYSVNSDGRVNTQAARIPLAQNIRLAFRALAAFVAPGYQPPFGDVGWEHLRKAIKIRDQLTHPKSLHDLEVSDADLETVRQGLGWYRVAAAAAAKIASLHAKAKFDAIVGSKQGEPRPKDEPSKPATEAGPGLEADEEGQ